MESSPPDNLQASPLRFPKFDRITQETDTQDIAALSKSDRPDSLNLSPTFSFSADALHSNADDISSPKYFSTPKLGGGDRRSLIRYNSQPARRINFTQSGLDDSPQGNAFTTPILDFTKLKTEAITPDSGFSTPAIDGFDSIASSPFLSMETGSNRSRRDSMFSSSLALSTLSTKVTPSSSSRLPSFLTSRSQGDYGSEAAPVDQALQESDLDKSLNLKTWLSNFCQTEFSTVPSSTSSALTVDTIVAQEKPKFPSSQSSQGVQQREATSHTLPGVLSMPQLTPIPVIMAPAAPKFSTGPQEGLLNPTATSQKRRALEELQPNTLRVMQTVWGYHDPVRAGYFELALAQQIGDKIRHCIFSVQQGDATSHTLPGVLSMPQLTPIPVIMAPAAPKFSTGPQEGLLNPTATSQKRRALEELQPNTLRVMQSEDERPNHSYMDLIKMALESSADGQMTLKEIVSWIEEHFLYFKFKAKQTWKNSIRYNLSLHRDFIKVEEKRHGGKWKLAADAKKYAYRIPKPPVVIQPPKPAPAVCVKKRKSGPQPILPKTMPYALVPIALTPFGLHGTKQDSVLDETSHSSHKQEEQEQQSLKLVYREQQQQYQEPQLLCNEKNYHQQQQQNEPPELLQNVQQPKELKLHFRLTQEQKQLIYTEKMQQQQRRSLLGLSKTQPPVKSKQPEGFRKAKFQPSNSLTQNFPSLHMPDRRRNLWIRDPSSKLQLIAPKPTTHTDTESSGSQPNIEVSSSASRPFVQRLQDSSVHSLCKPTNQNISKNRSICRILDRMPKSKSFDAVSYRKVPRDSTKKPRKQVYPSKPGPVMNLASMIREDRQAAEEINKILLLGNGDLSKPVWRRSAGEDSLVSERPGSEPGRDLLLQAWEETMSPLVMDEDSRGSCLSTGAENDLSLGFNLGKPSGPSVTAAGNSLGIDDTDICDIVEHGYHDINSCVGENEISEKSFADSMPQTSKVNVESTPASNVLLQSYDSIQSSLCTTPASVSETIVGKSSLDTSNPASSAFQMTTHSNVPSQETLGAKSTAVSSSLPRPQPRPGLYRTKSRRKQVHVPLVIDLSPKRDSTSSGQDEGSAAIEKTPELDQSNKEVKVQDKEQQQICPPDFSKSTSASNQHDLFDSIIFHKQFLTTEISKNQQLPPEFSFLLANEDSEKVNLISPICGSKSVSGQTDILSSSPSLFSSMTYTNMAANQLPSPLSFSQPCTVLTSTSHMANQEMSQQTSAMEIQSGTNGPTSSPKLNTPTYQDAQLSLPYSINSDVPFSTDSGFMNSGCYSESPRSLVKQPETINSCDPSKFSKTNMPKSYISNATRALNTDNLSFPHFLSLSNALSNVTKCNLQLQSIQSGHSFFDQRQLFEQGYPQRSTAQATQSFQQNLNPTVLGTSQVSDEGNPHAEKMTMPESLYSSDPPWQLNEGHCDSLMERSFLPQSTFVSSLHQPSAGTNSANAHQSSSLHSHQNHESPETDLSRNLFPIPSFEQQADWNHTSSSLSTGFYPSTVTSLSFQQQSEEQAHVLTSENVPNGFPSQQQIAFLQQCQHGDSFEKFLNL
ncbi:hypothetical protein EGW08_008666 [Elysia chlorotica]|uniref:Fork-head domain-containing protein n=1 Tax=Elysia chlorotica TaxID=188477 RepID=A0A433TPW3_ELYCH|nr:hypothetical protein EGW08_008666 [Elysia chlorotica]